MHEIRLELRLVDVESADFVALDRDQPRGAAELHALEFLRQRGSGRGVLDQHIERAMFLRQRDRSGF